ncbi:MAG: PepSY-associated TM helix domain-containing protein [Polyangiales bacterium]
MPTLGKKSERVFFSRFDRVMRRVRPFIRSLHRDAGYLAVGLTLIYAISGLAVNHIGQWDPNLRSYETIHELGPLPQDDAQASATVIRALHIDAQPREVYRASPDRLDVTFERRSLHINPLTGRVIEEGQKPRWLLYLVNWLHLNRGKKQWTIVADGYAIALLYLAISGVFMIQGRRGFFFRGAILVGIGVAIPTAYVVLSQVQ